MNSEPKSLEIIINAFSGRPNPSFVIEDIDEINAISEEFRGLTDQKKSRPIKRTDTSHLSKLGYRGLIVNDSQGVINGTPISFVICKEGIQLTMGSKEYLIFPDEEFKIEKQILAFGKKHNFIPNQILAALPDRLK